MFRCYRPDPVIAHDLLEDTEARNYYLQILREFGEFLDSRPDYVPKERTREYMEAIRRLFPEHPQKQIDGWQCLIDNPTLYKRPQYMRRFLRAATPHSLAELVVLLWVAAIYAVVVLNAFEMNPLPQPRPLLSIGQT